MMHALRNHCGLCPVSAVGVPPIAVGTKWMELVISTEPECPAGLTGRSSPMTRMATKTGVSGAKVRGRMRGCTAQAREYLLEVLPQFPELLSEFVQCRLGRRAAVDARAVSSSHLVTASGPKLNRRPRSAAFPNAKAKCTPRASAPSLPPRQVERGGQRERPAEGVNGPFPAGSCFPIHGAACGGGRSTQLPAPPSSHSRSRSLSPCHRR